MQVCFMLKLELSGAFTFRNYQTFIKNIQKQLFQKFPQDLIIRATSTKLQVLTLFFKTKPYIRNSCINRKCTGTKKAIILGAHMFNKKKNKKPSSGCSIYKTSSNNGIESESEFFWHQNQSIFRSQILANFLNSKQIYYANSQH